MRLLLSACFLALSVGANAEDNWPMRFVWTKGAEHKLVVLYRDGRAGYSARLLRPNSPEYHFVASSASWGLCRPELARTQRPLCIWVYVKGYSDGSDDPMRFDYELLGPVLTEFDKTGEQSVLHRLREDDRPWEAPNKSLERTRER
jgi:hypothetical protein